MEYSHCCRICLCPSSNLIGIFEFSTGLTLSERIMYCASVEINPIDRLPKYICSACRINLDIAYQFKTDCQESNRKLQRIIDLENINILRNLHKSEKETIRPEVVFFDDSSLFYEETVSSHIETEIEISNNSYDDYITSSSETVVEALEDQELNHKESNEIDRMDEKVVVIQMNANVVADISKSVTEKLSKSPVGRHVAKKNSSQIPRKISRFPESFSDSNSIKSKASAFNTTAITPITLQSDVCTLSEESPEELAHSFSCSICNKYYETHKQLMRHLKTHSRSKLHACKICKKVFKNKYNLTIHSLKHSGKYPLKCRICKKGFANMSILKRHCISHDGGTSFQCRYCNKEFPYEYSLRIHEAIHVDRPKYTCDICFKIFSYTNSLAAHLRGHKGSKPHVCKICSSAFTRNTSLRRHMNQNHGDYKMFSCRICEQEFHSKEECKIHETHIHLKLNCQFCSRKFSNKSLLAKHLNIHKSFPCKLCNKKYKSNNALLLHCKRIH